MRWRERRAWQGPFQESSSGLDERARSSVVGHIVSEVSVRNMTRMQRLFPAAYRFVPPTWATCRDMLEPTLTNTP